MVALGDIGHRAAYILAILDDCIAALEIGQGKFVAERYVFVDSYRQGLI